MGLRGNWFRRRRPSDDEMREELEAHVAMRAEHDGGDEAAARRRFGNLLHTRESMRRIWIAEWWDALRQDAWFTWRSWRRRPAFALSAILVLGLGLGASTAMFSALDRILFRPLPYGDADRLVNVGMTIPAVGAPGQSVVRLHSLRYQEYWKPAPTPFTAITTIQGTGDTCDVTEQQPERLICTRVESNFLQTFGVRPAVGRDFAPQDDLRGAPPVAIISHAVWTRRFGADPGAIGRTIDLNGTPIRVIGVLPAGFAMPRVEADILRPQQLYPLDPRSPFSASFLTAFGRLEPGMTPEQGEAAIGPLIAANARELRNGVRIGGDFVKAGIPDSSRPRVVPLRDYLVGDAARVAWLLLGAVGGLLLIACVNVANLVLARLAARTREFAVRSALGAGRARLARLALTESVLLAVAGGGLGLAFAAALLRVFVQLAPSSIPEIDQASLDLRVFAVAAVLALAAGAAVGIWPALAVLRSRALQYGPRATAAPRARMRFTLVTVQIAVTVAMLAGSALMLRTLWNLVAIPLGYDSERVVTMEVTLSPGRYPAASRDLFFQRVLQAIRAIPGTAAATMTSAAPPTGISFLGGIVAVDRQPRNALPPGAGMRLREVTPGYFPTFGIPILRGRTFAEADRAAQPIVILSESAGRILFPGQDPIGHTVRVPSTNEWAEVVGVAREVRNTGPTQEPDPELYTLWRPDGIASFGSTAFFAIRTRADTSDAVAFLRRAAADLDPQLPVTIEPLNEEVARLNERPRFFAWLLSAFAGLALLLAAAGLYGVASYLVTQRTRDIGVRIALGAGRGDVARQVIGEAGRWIAAGAAGGALLAWAVTQAIESQLFGVAAVDPVSWAGAFAVLGVALLAAVVRPAARAARVTPMAALQAD
jgi:predicted permease